MTTLLPVREAISARRSPKNPLVPTFYWIAVLLLTLWVVLQGFGDMLTTATHARASLARVRRKRRELEKEISELQSRRSNGDPTSV